MMGEIIWYIFNVRRLFKKSVETTDAPSYNFCDKWSEKIIGCLCQIHDQAISRAACKYLTPVYILLTTGLVCWLIRSNSPGFWHSMSYKSSCHFQHSCRRDLICYVYLLAIRLSHALALAGFLHLLNIHVLNISLILPNPHPGILWMTSTLY